MNMFDKINFNALFVFIDICLIEGIIYYYKGANACYFKLLDSDFTFVDFLSSIAVLIIFIFAYVAGYVNQGANQLEKKLSNIISILLISGLFFFLFSGYEESLSLVFILFASILFILSLFVTLKKLGLANYSYKAKLYKWVGISIVVVVLSVMLDVQAVCGN